MVSFVCFLFINRMHRWYLWHIVIMWRWTPWIHRHHGTKLLMMSWKNALGNHSSLQHQHHHCYCYIIVLVSYRTRISWSTEGWTLISGLYFLSKSIAVLLVWWFVSNCGWVKHMREHPRYRTTGHLSAHPVECIHHHPHCRVCHVYGILLLRKWKKDERKLQNFKRERAKLMKEVGNERSMMSLVRKGINETIFCCKDFWSAYKLKFLCKYSWK